MPTIEEKLPLLKKPEVFTIVDVSEAFHTTVVDEKFFLLTTFQGPNGRCCYNSTPFGWVWPGGIPAATARILRRSMQCNWHRQRHLHVWVWRHKGRRWHRTRPKLGAALGEVSSTRSTAFSEKRQVKSPSVTLIGQKLTHKGVEPDPAKVAAIR